MCPTLSVLSMYDARLHLVIGRSLVDLGGTVDLLGQHHPRPLVREGLPPQERTSDRIFAYRSPSCEHDVYRWPLSLSRVWGLGHTMGLRDHNSRPVLRAGGRPSAPPITIDSLEPPVHQTTDHGAYVSPIRSLGCDPCGPRLTALESLVQHVGELLRGELLAVLVEADNARGSILLYRPQQLLVRLVPHRLERQHRPQTLFIFLIALV